MRAGRLEIYVASFLQAQIYLSSPVSGLYTRGVSLECPRSIVARTCHHQYYRRINWALHMQDQQLPKLILAFANSPLQTTNVYSATASAGGSTQLHTFTSPLLSPENTR